MFLQSRIGKVRNLLWIGWVAVALCSCGASTNFEVLRPQHGIVEIPLKLERGDTLLDGTGRAYLDVKIGNRKIPVLLDLGHFSTVALPDTMLHSLPIELNGTSTKYTDVFGNTRRMRNYIIPTCEIGNLECAKVEGTAVHSEEREGGILGLGFLRKFTAIIFDY